jgi:integrase
MQKKNRQISRDHETATDGENVGRWHFAKRGLVRRQNLAAKGLGWNTLRHTTCEGPARNCYTNGGEIEQIQFLLGHASVQTTERYLGANRIWDIR